LDTAYGAALAFAAFVIIVITVTQLALRFMRLVLAEAFESVWAPMKNVHIGTIISGILMVIVVLSGTFVYLWQLFGGANQLMAALALILVTLWLISEKRNPTYAFWPMVFMYVTTIAANLITAWNLYATVVLPSLGQPGRGVVIAGAILMILIAIFLVLAALYIGYDAWRAYLRSKTAAPAPAPAD
jgi:carbon starvation protein